MKIVELKYIPPRTLNYMIPILGGEQSDENDPSDTESPPIDEPSEPEEGQAEDPDASS